ncbi:MULTISPECIES: lipoprotein LpqH [unclassified Gordonia (in: high G+C Gram-positive bacteria)]|uniref:lipoprotein LpqH n=1 Tax=unclassified Gordonia (in: high G+C Gram-positive bacteria) TaxID=2657482 RepID=UPI001F1158B1|nr:lipoprotein LpqH [Gordonia sp. ABSL49_1]MCH5642362.1 lipoprotein LpqH [Gordonia sp. ABSL49_1]
MRKVQIIPVIGVVGLAVTLSACGSDDDDSASVETNNSGSATVTVGGESVDVTGKTVACAEQNGKVVIGIGSATGTGAIGATVTSGDSPQVETVGIATTDGVNYGWVKGTGKNATATKDGKNYTISGEVTGVSLSNPTAGPQTKQFEMKVTCP